MKSQNGWENIILSSVIKNVNIFPVIKQIILKILIAYSVTVHCIHSEKIAEEISDIQKMELKIVRIVLCLTKEKIMDMLLESTVKSWS